ncbi:MAG TPA: mechanosensitive ion channel domain-containing protein [Natrialbaceae archaeon]|nr:mechanosensitive ion channel domain-containing protein [Natrialbaceae archaeon]
MVNWELFVGRPIVRGTIVLVIGVTIGFLFGRLFDRVMRAVGVPEMVEGTPFERSAQSLGSDTVAILARLASWFIYGVTVLVAINVASVFRANFLWLELTRFIPQLFIATLVVIVGFVVADKAELVLSERTRSVKIPEAAILPRVVKYSILYIAFLIALSQIGVSTRALVVLLAAYLFALIFIGGLAFRDLLRAGATGMYILLNEPYSIGDEIRVGEYEGIVQGVDVFTTRIESEDEETVFPNHLVFERGVTRARE